MIITLFQPGINNCNCDNDEIVAGLDEAQKKKSDLLVFPEYYPFWEGKASAPSYADIVDDLKSLIKGRSCAFMAGGLACRGVTCGISAACSTTARLWAPISSSGSSEMNSIPRANISLSPARDHVDQRAAGHFG